MTLKGKLCASSQIFRPLAIIIILAASIQPLQMASAGTSDYYVSRDNGVDSITCGSSNVNPCKTIGQAINNALPEATIHIGPGIYPENLTISKNVSLVGTAIVLMGKVPTTIDGQGVNRVIKVNAVNVSLTNLIIQNGHLPPAGSLTDLQGAGIYNQNGQLSLNHVTVQNNQAADPDPSATNFARGGGIFNIGTLVIQNSTIQNNKNSEWGGGIESDDGNVTIENSVISNNTLTKGGSLSGTGGGGLALMTSGNQQIIIHGASIINNSAAGRAGLFMNVSLSTNSNPAEISDSLISGNTSTYGAAAFDIYGKLRMTNDTISENISTEAIDVIHVESSSSLTMDHVTIAGEFVPSNKSYGGYAIYIRSGSSMTVSNSILSITPHTSYQYLCDSGNPLTSAGNNLFAETMTENPTSISCTSTLTGGDHIFNISGLQLDTLGDHGGPTKTYALLPGSPAIDRAGSSSLTMDQRGIAYQDGDGDGTVNADIGSFEVALKPTFTASVNQPSIIPGQSTTLKLRIDNPNSSPAALTAGINFDLPVGLDIAGGGFSNVICTWGTFTGTAAVGSTPAHITLVNAKVDAQGFCELTIPISSSILGSYSILAGRVSSKEAGDSANAAPVEIVVAPEIAIGGLSATATTPVGLGTITHFAASVSAGTNISYTWDFGDGATGSGATVDHTYAQAGEYTAQVTATNSAGTSHSNVLVSVHDRITGLKARTTPPSYCGSATHFQASFDAGSHVVFSWNFGDGESGTGAEVDHVYARPGQYTVRVTAENGAGTATDELTVTIGSRLFLPGILR